MCREKLVQEAVDTLLDDNGIRGQLMRDGHNKVYKSFSDVIEGKEGRFRETLLGKRVDYSGSSVIVVGPSLSLHQCGLPREIAIELFHTFVIHGLIRQHIASNIGVAKNFDGDQMAVHIPLSLEAQAEACLLMFSHMNLLSPAIGDPISVPTQDMLMGLYVLTVDNRRETIHLDSPLWLRWRLDQRVIAPREVSIEVQCESFGTYNEIYGHYLIGGTVLMAERADLVFHNKAIDGLP
ncbi:hypothetical protein IFM89_030282 [Coptis chinensis]|uniref:DNA-directed RNA polymerase n=1 Tax=Coptis chinensis TaxID=261450 RepID=A0A835M7L5_9MAGN|nr:hypothetical protein IFM89_030282 [Coptis chinensis]